MQIQSRIQPHLRTGEHVLSGVFRLACLDWLSEYLWSILPVPAGIVLVCAYFVTEVPPFLAAGVTFILFPAGLVLALAIRRSGLAGGFALTETRLLCITSLLPFSPLLFQVGTLVDFTSSHVRNCDLTYWLDTRKDRALFPLLSGPELWLSPRRARAVYEYVLAIACGVAVASAARATGLQS